ncbi:unnamed protein product, partial [Gulo gulo]
MTAMKQEQQPTPGARASQAQPADQTLKNNFQTNSFAAKIL